MVANHCGAYFQWLKQKLSRARGQCKEKNQWRDFRIMYSFCVCVMCITYIFLASNLTCWRSVEREQTIASLNSFNTNDFCQKIWELLLVFSSKLFSLRSHTQYLHINLYRCISPLLYILFVRVYTYMVPRDQYSVYREQRG